MTVPTDFEVPSGAADHGKFPVYDSVADEFKLRHTNVVYVPVDGAANAGDAVDVSGDIQDVLDALDSAGAPSVIQLGPGYFGIGTRLEIPHNVIIRGAGRAVTILYATADVGILSGPGTSLADSVLGCEDLTIWGYADRNPTLGDDSQRAINFNRADYIWVQNVHVRYSRQMSITGIGDVEARVNNCVVEKSHRDGINLTQSDKAIILNNTLMQIGDDGIAYHVPNGLSAGAVRSHSAVIVGNRLYKSAGIKVLGATNVTVTGNSGRFMNGYGVFCDGDIAALEGLKDPLGWVVTGNTFVDIIDLTYYGSGTNQFGIMLSAFGPDPGNLGGYPALVGPGNGTNAAIVNNNQAWNKVVLGGTGAGQEHTGAYGVLIDGNTCMQTLEGSATNFSDFGFGEMWWTSGSVDFAFLGNIWRSNGTGGTSQGLRMAGGMLRDVMVCNNKFYGFRRNVDIEYIPVAAQGRWVNNTFTRSENAFHAVSSSSFSHADFWFEGNDIDLDPLFESSARETATGQPTGAWTGASNDATVAYFFGLSGLHLVRNKIKNASRITLGTDIRMDGNTIYCDAAVSGLGGVLATDAELAKSTIVQYVADPRLATYGQIKAGYNLSNTAMPASGAWCKGTFVKNETPTISAGQIVYGWLRLTTGTGNVANTDWAEVRTFASGMLLKGTATYDPASANDDAEIATTTVTVTGAALGDVVVGAGHTTQDELWEMRATVTAANTVTVQLVNRSGGTVDLTSGTLTVYVMKQ